MINAIRRQNPLTLHCLIAALIIFSGAPAMADDVYGTYRLAEKEFATVPGQKHTETVSVWKQNKDIVKIPSYKLKIDENDRRYARIEHDATSEGEDVVLAGNSSQKQDTKKVLAVYQLVQKDSTTLSGKVYKDNVFVWLKNPETPKPEMKLVKTNGKTILVHVDRNQEDRNRDQSIQLAKQSVVDE